jgi:predicted ABC-type ATPase
MYVRRIPEWRNLGYRVKLIYLQLETVELAILRVAARVAQGGHDVPEDVIRRRFEIGRRNFDQVYKPLVNAWVMYDNSREAPLLLESGGTT